MKKQLRSVNMLAFVIHGMVGIRLLKLPRDIVEYAENNGWISVLLATILSIFTGYTFYWVGTKYPELNFSQIIEVVLGKFFGKLILIVIAVYTISSVAMGARSFSDSIKLFLLDATPLYTIILVMLAICTYCIRKGIKTISIVFDILLPFVLGSILLLFLLASTNIDTGNLLPVFYGGAKPVFKGFLEIIHPFLGIGIIGYILPYFANQKEVKKWIGIGIAIVTIIYLGIVILSIMAFGVSELQMLIYPTITLLKAIQLRAEIFERVESLFITIWIPITFTTLVIYYYASCLNLKALFQTNRDKLVIYGQVPIFFILALLPKNIVEVGHYLNLINYLAQVLSFIVIPLVAIATFIKIRRKSRQ